MKHEMNNKRKRSQQQRKSFKHTNNNNKSWELIKVNKKEHMKSEKQLPAINKIDKKVNSYSTVNWEEVNKTTSTSWEMSANNKLPIEKMTYKEADQQREKWIQRKMKMINYFSTIQYWLKTIQPSNQLRNKIALSSSCE